MPALLIDNTTNPKSVLLTAQSTSQGDLTLNTGTSLNLGGFLCSIAGATLTNNGTITNTTAGGRFDLTGSAPQTYTGSGTMTPGGLNIELDNPSGLTIDPASPAINVLRLNLWRGAITNAYKLTLGTAGASSAAIQVGVSGATGPGGSLRQRAHLQPRHSRRHPYLCAGERGAHHRLRSAPYPHRAEPHHRQHQRRHPRGRQPYRSTAPSPSPPATSRPRPTP